MLHRVEDSHRQHHLATLGDVRVDVLAGLVDRVGTVTRGELVAELLVDGLSDPHDALAVEQFQMSTHCQLFSLGVL